MSVEDGEQYVKDMRGESSSLIGETGENIVEHVDSVGLLIHLSLPSGIGRCSGGTPSPILGMGFCHSAEI